MMGSIVLCTRCGTAHMCVLNSLRRLCLVWIEGLCFRVDGPSWVFIFTDAGVFSHLFVCRINSLRCVIWFSRGSLGRTMGEMMDCGFDRRPAF